MNESNTHKVLQHLPMIIQSWSASDGMQETGNCFYITQGILYIFEKLGEKTMIAR